MVFEKEIRSIIKSIKNAFLSWKGKKQLRASKELISERLKICNSCPSLKKDKYFFFLKRDKCGICGCVKNWKVKWTSEKCPLDSPKW